MTKLETKKEKAKNEKKQSYVWEAKEVRCEWRGDGYTENTRQAGDMKASTMLYLHIALQSKLVSPRGPVSLFLLIGNEAQLPYSGPSRQGLDCCCLLEQAKCGNDDWIAMWVQERKTFGNEEIPILVIMIQNGILSYTKYSSQVFLVWLLCFHWQWMWWAFFLQAVLSG